MCYNIQHSKGDFMEENEKRIKSLDEKVIDYMYAYNQANEKSLEKNFTNYIMNREKIAKLHALKEKIEVRIFKKQNKLYQITYNTNFFINKYKENIEKLNNANNKYFKYKKSIIKRICYYKEMQKLEKKMNYYSCNLKLLIMKIKQSDEFYFKEQAKLICLENMLIEINKKIDLYENPAENIEIENRNKQLLNIMGCLNTLEKNRTSL